MAFQTVAAQNCLAFITRCKKSTRISLTRLTYFLLVPLGVWEVAKVNICFPMHYILQTESSLNLLQFSNAYFVAYGVLSANKHEK